MDIFIPAVIFGQLGSDARSDNSSLGDEGLGVLNRVKHTACYSIYPKAPTALHVMASCESVSRAGDGLALACTNMYDVACVSPAELLHTSPHALPVPSKQLVLLRQLHMSTNTCLPLQDRLQYLGLAGPTSHGFHSVIRLFLLNQIQSRNSESPSNILYIYIYIIIIIGFFRIPDSTKP